MGHSSWTTYLAPPVLTPHSTHPNRRHESLGGTKYAKGVKASNRPDHKACITRLILLRMTKMSTTPPSGSLKL